MAWLGIIVIMLLKHMDTHINALSHSHWHCHGVLEYYILVLRDIAHTHAHAHARTHWRLCRHMHMMFVQWSPILISYVLIKKYVYSSTYRTLSPTHLKMAAAKSKTINSRNGTRTKSPKVSKASRARRKTENEQYSPHRMICLVHINCRLKIKWGRRFNRYVKQILQSIKL